MSDGQQTMEDRTPMDEKPYRYPWARALMIVVLYGALLVFLWHFPTSGGRAFFQTLFQGFLYILAGLALVGVTVVFFMFFPLPPRRVQDDKDILDGDEDTYEDGELFGGVFSARSVLVPPFKNPDIEPRVWDILYNLQQELSPDCVIAADAQAGIIAVTDDDEAEADYVLREIRSRLRSAGIAVRSPR